MSDSVSSPGEPRGENKFFTKPKWRGKLFSVDGRFGRAVGNAESTDEDINRFLHTSDLRTGASIRSAPLAPRIDVDVALRQPPVASVVQDDGIVDVYRRPKPRQNKGLRVRFQSNPPEIIGIGGDEAELPSRDVSNSFRHPLRSEKSPSREQPHYTGRDQHSEEYGRSGDSEEELPLRFSSPKRRPSNVHHELFGAESFNIGHGREAIQPAPARLPESSPQPRGVGQDFDLDIRTEDGNLFFQPPPANEKASFDKRYNRQTAETRTLGTAGYKDVTPPEASSVNHFTLNEPPGSPYTVREAFSQSQYPPPATRDLLEFPNSAHRGTRQDLKDASHDSKEKPLSLRSVAKGLGEEFSEDFDLRVRRFNDLFRLNASSHVDMMALPFERWIRASVWWFLKGRGGLENTVRAKSSAIAPATAAFDDESSSILNQAYINLAKAWWILKYVTPDHHAIRRFGSGSMGSMVAVIRNFGNKPLAELVEVHQNTMSQFRALIMSMTRNRRLPPDDLQIQRLESQIFLETPNVPQGIAALIINTVLEPTIKDKNYVVDPFFPILLGDTLRHFSFGKMFVDVILENRDNVGSKFIIPCVLSILRERTAWAVKAAVTSQDGRVNLVIQSDEHGGLHWHDVQWNIPQHTIQLDIAENTRLQIKFSEKDFRAIWGICDYTQRIRKDYSPRRGELVVFERELPLIQCYDCPSFPMEPVKDCRVRLFERESLVADDSGQQKAHDGYRLMVITPPGTKTLSNVNCHLGKDSPILFSTYGNSGRNTLLVRAPSILRASLTFNEASDVDLFRSILSGTSINEDDQYLASINFQNFAINPIAADHEFAYMDANRCISVLGWRKLRVVHIGSSSHGHDSQSKIRSGKIRILADCDSGTLTDRISTVPGQLHLSLSTVDLNEIKLLRAAQQDMTWSFVDGFLSEADLSLLSKMLQCLGTSPSTRAYRFRSLSDLHTFQATLTGFHVLYDGVVRTLSISRPRMVVPVHKHWEASSPRLQILRQDKTVQLVAFFQDFNHGACMNFVLKVTDVFETFARSGAFSLRIVDAKFALPKSETDSARDFVCLDQLDYPTEHDDIVIGFDDEEGTYSKRPINSEAGEFWTNEVADRDGFARALPAPVNKTSLMASLRR